MFALHPSDRVLIVAPHPDDESIATGGLIQHAVAAGARVRILFATNGDNNPWAQRALEKRWRIGPAERVRWAARRRAEAIEALRVLGLEKKAARFLNLPDQGLTGLLMGGGEPVLAPLEEELTFWQPSIVAGPASDDVHPDHSALHVLLSFALQGSHPPGCRRFDFLVHRPRQGAGAMEWMRTLTLAEQERKRRAIECHRTQTFLSRRRFCAYAAAGEGYRLKAPELRPAEEPGAVWRLTVPMLPGRAGSRLLLAGCDPEGEPFRWSLLLPRRPGPVHPRDERTGTYLKPVALRHEPGSVSFLLPRRLAHPGRPFYAKIAARGLFFDRAGWHRLDWAGFRGGTPVRPASASPVSAHLLSAQS